MSLITMQILLISNLNQSTLTKTLQTKTKAKKWTTIYPMITQALGTKPCPKNLARWCQTPMEPMLAASRLWTSSREWRIASSGSRRSTRDKKGLQVQRAPGPPQASTQSALRDLWKLRDPVSRPRKTNWFRSCRLKTRKKTLEFRSWRENW